MRRPNSGVYLCDGDAPAIQRHRGALADTGSAGEENLLHQFEIALANDLRHDLPRRQAPLFLWKRQTVSLHLFLLFSLRCGDIR